MDYLKPKTIVSIFIGTILGAGFASGQELMQFFLKYSSFGYLGLAGAGVVLFIATFSIMLYSKRNNFRNYSDLFNNRPLAKKLTDYYISIFTFFLIGVMTAGAGSLFNTLTSKPNFIGIGIMILLSFFCIAAGLKTAYSILQKVLSAAIILIIITSVFIILNGNNTAQNYLVESKIPWYISAVIFVSNNIVALIVVLVPISSRTKSRKTILISTGTASLIVVIIAFFCLLAMQYNLSNIISSEIPMIPLAFMVHPLLGIIYSIVMFIAIFTTIICCTISLCERLAKSKLKMKYNYWVMLILLFASFLSRYSFSALIRVIYSLAGIIGFIIIISIFINLIFNRKNNSNL